MEAPFNLHLPERNRQLRPQTDEVLLRAAGQREWVSVFQGDGVVYGAAVLLEGLMF